VSFCLCGYGLNFLIDVWYLLSTKHQSAWCVCCVLRGAGRGGVEHSLFDSGPFRFSGSVYRSHLRSL